ncbi:MAG: OmpA family protein [Bacillota bacterium]
MSRNMRKKQSREEGAPLWMVTYSDLVTLVLVFFILLYSFSIIDIIKFQRFIASFQGAGILSMGPQPLESPPEPESQDITSTEGGFQDAKQMDFSDIIEENPLVEVYHMVLDYIEEHNLANVVDVRFEVRGIALEIKDKILFDSAKAKLTPNAKEVLAHLEPLLRDLPYMISVEGHTDNRPINNKEFPSNWELSTARALNVVRYFIEELGLEPQRFAVVGLGEYHPVVPNDSPENWQLNRRVVIVVNAENPFKSEVLDSDGKDTERKSGN